MVSIGNWWSVLLQTGESGISWLYNNTIGAAESYFGNVAMSSAQTFVLQLLNGFLSLFASVIGHISGIGVYWADDVGYISSTMGIFGPFFAVIIALGLLMVMVLVVKLIVVLL